MSHIQNGIVEGEPGIFPAPVTRILVGLGRLVRGKRSANEPDQAPAPRPPEQEPRQPPE